MDTIEVASICNREGTKVGHVIAAPDHDQHKIEFTIDITSSHGQRIVNLWNNHVRIMLVLYLPHASENTLTSGGCPGTDTDPADLNNLLKVMTDGELTIKYDTSILSRVYPGIGQRQSAAPVPICRLLWAYRHALDKHSSALSQPEAKPRHTPTPPPKHHTRAAQVPHWDSVQRQLRLGEQLIKWFRRPAPNQELILTVFQEEGWPRSVLNPLRPDPLVDAKQRLHDTIKSLNRSQLNRLIVFGGDGTGKSIFWRLAKT